MNSSSCVMVIERLIARRGPSSVIWSDNCTNCAPAEKKLRLCILSRNTQAPAQVAHTNLKWKLNPPVAATTVGRHGNDFFTVVSKISAQF